VAPTREEAHEIYETGSPTIAEKFYEAGWVLIELLQAPSAGGGSIYVLGWIKDAPPVFPEV
jgi:hypothetical protein